LINQPHVSTKLYYVTVKRSQKL